MYSSYFVIISNWKVTFVKLWIPFIQGCFVPSLVEIGQWSWRERFIDIVNLFSSPLEKRRGPSFEQTYIPYTKGCFVQSLAQWFSSIIFFILFNVFSLFCYYLLLEKSRDFHQSWIPFTQWGFAQSLVEIGPMVL